MCGQAMKGIQLTLGIIFMFQIKQGFNCHGKLYRRKFSSRDNKVCLHRFRPAILAVDLAQQAIVSKKIIFLRYGGDRG